MANCRSLKKDVNSLHQAVINECSTFLDHSPYLNQENVQVIIDDANALRNDLMNRINNPLSENNSPASVRTYYRNIREELNDRTITLIERLNKLPR